MSKKLLIIGLVTVIIASGFSYNQVFAKKVSDNEVPQKEGVYDVPGHPNLKVKVFVYRGKPGRPTPTPTPTPSPVCHLPDLDSTAIVHQMIDTNSLQGLHLPIGTWTYVLNTSSVPSSVGSSNLAIMAADAFSHWSSAINPLAQISFAKSPNNTGIYRAKMDGKNIITWGNAPSGALAVSWVWYYPSTGEVAEVDTVMNKSYSWAWSNPEDWHNPATTCAYQNAYDAQDILTHELGHTVGLDDEYEANYENATMYGWGSMTEILKDTLSSGDIAGVGSIY